MEKPATDPYNLRTRAQTRSQTADRWLDTADVEEGVAATVGEIARQTDYQTDMPIRHQSDYSTTSMAPALAVRPHFSGLSSHAQETRSETSSQLSIDTTIDLTIQELFAEDSTPACTDTDTFSRGLWEDRPALPGLNLPVAGALFPGASQGLDPWNPSLLPLAATESCPRAVEPLHLTGPAGTRGTGHSTEPGDEPEPYTEPGQYFHQTTANTTPTNHGLTYAIARICHGNSVRLSVCLSVCHTGGSVKNG